jgi:hypothetical protein
MRLLPRLFRVERPPAEALAALETGERLTSWGSTTGGDVVLATTRGLWLPASGGHERRRLPWHTIHKATWDQSSLRIVPGVEIEPGVVADGPAMGVHLLEPRDLPAEVRTRVTRSVAHSSHHPLPGGGGVRVVARRVAGVDGLSWALRYDDGVDRHDPEVQQAAAELLDRARAVAEVPI